MEGTTRFDDLVDRPLAEVLAGTLHGEEAKGRRVAETLWRELDEDEFGALHRTVVIDDIAEGASSVGCLLRAKLLDVFPLGTRHEKIRRSPITRAVVIRWNEMVEVLS